MIARVLMILRYGAAAGLLALLAPPLATAESEVDGLRGHLLVAADTMPDPRFEQTVIYLFDHGAGAGSLGLVVNKPLGDLPLERILDSMGAEAPSSLGQVRAYYGGPVEPTRASLLLPPRAAAGGDPTPAVVSSLEKILNAIVGEEKPRRSIFVLGYSGWSSGQLEAEIAAGDWYIIPFDEALVFGGEFEQMWDRALQRRAVEL